VVQRRVGDLGDVEPLGQEAIRRRISRSRFLPER
jgi:hypothetical protein